MKRRDLLRNALIMGGSLLLLKPRYAFAAPTIISSFPYVISSPGTYVLDQNHSLSMENGAAIIISSDFVTLDLQGFTLSNSYGDTTYAKAVHIGRGKKVTVTNGAINGFYTSILSQIYGTLTGLTIDTITSNSYAAGFYVSGFGNIVQDCAVSFSGHSSVPSTSGCTGAIGIVVSHGIGTLIKNTSVDLADAGDSDGTVCIYFARECPNGVVLDSALSNADAGIVCFDAYTYADYRGVTTSSVTFPYIYGNDLGNNT